MFQSSAREQLRMVLIGVIHEATVQGMLKGIKTSCQYQCDSDFGCHSCILAGLTAMPEEPKDIPPKRKAAVARLPMDSSHIPWVANTGAAQDMLSRADAQHGDVYESPWPLRFSTANENIFGTSKQMSRSTRPRVLFGHTFLMKLQLCYPWV